MRAFALWALALWALALWAVTLWALRRSLNFSRWVSAPCPTDPNVEALPGLGNTWDARVHDHEHGCEMHPEALREAFRGGHVECVEYLDKRTESFDLPVLGDLSDMMRDRYSESCVDYALERYWVSPQQAVRAALTSGNVDALAHVLEVAELPDDDRERLCADAVGASNAAALGWCIDAGFPCHQNAFEKAALLNDIDCVEVLLSRGVPHGDAAGIAAYHGHKDIEALLLSHGARRTSFACGMASATGQLDKLRQLHGAGWELDLSCWRAAFVDGHVRCLEYVMSQGVTGRVDPGWVTKKRTPRQNRSVLECVRAAVKAGCACDVEVLMQAVEAIPGTAMDAYRFGGRRDPELLAVVLRTLRPALALALRDLPPDMCRTVISRAFEP